MKKIKLTVGALLLGGMCYSQCTDNSSEYTMINKKELTYLSMSIQDLQQWIKSNVKTDDIPPEIGHQYILHLLDLESKLEDISNGESPYTREMFNKIYRGK